MMDEVEYLRARVGQEDKAAKRATSVEAELIHRTLATNYARKAVAAVIGEIDDRGSVRGRALGPDAPLLKR